MQFVHANLLLLLLLLGSSTLALRLSNRENYALNNADL